MDGVFWVAFGGLGITAALLLVRVARGPSTADRIVALDNLALCLVAGIAIAAARRMDGTYLDAMVITALLGFVSSTAGARFLESRRRDPREDRDV